MHISLLSSKASFFILISKAPFLLLQFILVFVIMFLSIHFVKGKKKNCHKRSKFKTAGPIQVISLV